AAQQRIAVQDLAGIAGQQEQQVELGSGELQQRALQVHVAGGRIDAQFTEAQGAIAWLDPSVATQVGTQPGQQHPRFDRLADVIIGAQFQSQHLVDVVGAGGQHADDAVI
ncbi:hypothetical protein LTR94_035446, partial [Friedmanniomyces endolithicus]